MRKLASVLFLLAISAFGQVSSPQIPLTGNIGPGGVFPLVNSGTIVMTDSDYVMSYPDMSAVSLQVTSSVPLTTTRKVIAPLARGFEFVIQNSTAGGQSITVIGSTGTGVTLANGATALVMSNGTNYVNASTSFGPQPSGYVFAGPQFGTGLVVPSIVQSKICQSAASTTITCTLTSGTLVGDLIVVGGSYTAGTSAVTDNLGQTYTRASDPYVALYYKEATAAGVNTVTITTSGGGSVVVWEIQNAALSNSLDAAYYNVGNISGPNTPITFNQITTLNANDIILGYWSCSTNSVTTPTASSPWLLGNYAQLPSNSWSGGWVWRSVNVVGTYTPAVSTANCPTQQNSYSVAFKAALQSTTAAPAFRPLIASDLPATPWSSLTNPAHNALTELDMNTSATIWFSNLYATNTTADYGFAFGIADNSPGNRTGQSPYLFWLQSNHLNHGAFQVQDCAAPTPVSNCSGFQDDPSTGNLVAVGYGKFVGPLQLPAILSASSLATDSSGNVIAGAAGSASWPTLAGGVNSTGNTYTVGAGTTFNVASTGAFDLSGGGANALKVPSGAGLTPSSLGGFTMDTTLGRPKIYNGTASIQLLATTDVSVPPGLGFIGQADTANPPTMFNVAPVGSKCYPYQGTGGRGCDTPSAGSSALSSITAGTTTNTINNGNNSQTWNWQLTGSTPMLGMTFGENVASTNSGTNSAIVLFETLAGSTVWPMRAANVSAGFGASPTGDLTTFGGSHLVLGGITGSTQCLHASSTGVVSGTGSDCPTSTGGGGGVNAYSSTTTLSASDDKKLATFNGSSLTANMPASPPSATWSTTIQNLNSTALTVSRNGLTINGGTNNVTLQQYQRTSCYTDNANYFCSTPDVQGTNVTLTPGSGGQTISATGTGGVAGQACVNTTPGSGQTTAPVVLISCGTVTLVSGAHYRLTAGIHLVTTASPGALQIKVFQNGTGGTALCDALTDNGNLSATAATYDGSLSCEFDVTGSGTGINWGGVFAMQSSALNFVRAFSYGSITPSLSAQTVDVVATTIGTAITLTGESVLLYRVY